MHSYKQFTPGKKANAFKAMVYAVEYNKLFPNKTPLNCVCYQDKYDKFVVGSDSASTRIGKNMRISQIINTSTGGNTQYGNFYLGQPLNLNYLGRAEGMPGGSGIPPKNRF